MMIYILIISTVFFVGVVFYLAQLVVLGLEQPGLTRTCWGPRDVFGKIIEQKRQGPGRKSQA